MYQKVAFWEPKKFCLGLASAYFLNSIRRLVSPDAYQMANRSAVPGELLIL